VRYELLDEFQRQTGVHFGIVDFARFLELNGAKDETVKEAKASETRQSFSSDLAGIFRIGVKKLGVPRAVGGQSLFGKADSLFGKRRPRASRDALRTLLDRIDEFRLALIEHMNQTSDETWDAANVEAIGLAGIERLVVGDATLVASVDAIAHEWFTLAQDYKALGTVDVESSDGPQKFNDYYEHLRILHVKVAELEEYLKTCFQNELLRPQ
jgi:hypothetical protein